MRVPVNVFVRAVKADDHIVTLETYIFYVFIVEAFCITPTVNVCIYSTCYIETDYKFSCTSNLSRYFSENDICVPCVLMNHKITGCLR